MAERRKEKRTIDKQDRKDGIGGGQVREERERYGDEGRE